MTHTPSLQTSRPDHQVSDASQSVTAVTPISVDSLTSWIGAHIKGGNFLEWGWNGQLTGNRLTRANEAGAAQVRCAMGWRPAHLHRLDIEQDQGHSLYPKKRLAQTQDLEKCVSLPLAEPDLPWFSVANIYGPDVVSRFGLHEIVVVSGDQLTAASEPELIVRRCALIANKYLVFLNNTVPDNIIPETSSALLIGMPGWIYAPLLTAFDNQHLASYFSSMSRTLAQLTKFPDGFDLSEATVGEDQIWFATENAIKTLLNNNGFEVMTSFDTKSEGMAFVARRKLTRK